MSFLASVITGRSDDPEKPVRSTPDHARSKYLRPTLDLNNDSNNTVKFQKEGTSNGNASPSSSLRFFLPLVMDSVNDISYKISVPNFANLPPLRLTCKYITDLIQIDSMTPGDLYAPSLANQNAGLDNYYFDYANGLGSFSRFEKVSQMDLPDRFFEEYNLTQCASKMGLFPEINRAWIAVDNKLVLWNYKLPQSSFNQSSQFLTIDQISHFILSVKLVKPKPGVFVADANHLLVIATTMDIHIFVVKYDLASNTLDIFNPKLSVSVQGLIVNQIVVNEITNDIYFSGDGDATNVWRLDYSNNSSFIKNKCDKVCLTKKGFSSVLPIGKIPGFDMFTTEHESASAAKKASGAQKLAAIPEALVQLEIDAERNILYSLSNKSVIRVYKLAPKQEHFLQHSQLTPSEIFKSISQIIPDSANIKSFLKFKIVSISAVTQKESLNVLLIAITNYGNRILLRFGGPTSYSSFMSTTSTSLSIKLSVASMKFPPSKEEAKMNTELDSFTRVKQYVALMISNQQNSELLKNTKLGKIISPGVFLAVKKTKNSDLLFISSVNYGFLKHNHKLVEDAELINLGSPVTSSNSSPLIVNDIVQLTPSMNASDSPSGYANVLAAQYSKKPLEFAVLTNYGISIYQYRTSDKIIGSLKENVIENFIDENGFEETCSTLLYLACSSGNYSPDAFQSKAQFLFSHAGNDARSAQPQSNNQNLQQLVPTSDPQPLLEKVILSDRFYGTCLLISRIFREHWNTKVFSQLPHITSLPDGSIDISSVKEDNLLINGLNIEKQKVEYFIGSVIVLLEFFNDNLNKIPGLSAPKYSSDPSKVENEVCTRAEHIAFTSIVRSLNSMKEALSFIMVLIEETQTKPDNFNEIFRFLSLTNQLNLLTLKFSDLLLPKMEVRKLIKDLLSSIINKTILNGGSIDLIASSLQGRCASFCSKDDVYIFKAIENLTRAKNIGNRDNELKVKCLHNAVALFEQASGSLTLENIENSIDIMLSLDFYTGAIDFLLKLSKKLYGILSVQTESIVLGMGESNASDVKSRLEDNNQKRLQLYDFVFKILTNLDSKVIKITETGNQLMINELVETRDIAYDTCFASTDKLFHYEFYQWFINHGCSERLLTVETPYILPFLEHASQDNLDLSQLLWLYHAKRENYFQAAKILYSLAISEFSLTMRQRIEFLSRANGFCNCTCPPSLRQELTQLSTLIRELFEVGNVQLNLLQTIQTDSRIGPKNQEIAMSRLNYKIRNASELFNGFADPLGYYEICLIIFYISDYKNPDEILKRWELLFEKIYYDFSQGVGQDPVGTRLSEALISVGVKIHSNDMVFPVSNLIKLMCKYILIAVEENGAATPRAGIVVDTFLKCGISFESIYVTMKLVIQNGAHSLQTGLIKYLKSSEMVYLIQVWCQRHKNIRDFVDMDKVATMTEYSIQDDPLETWMRTQGS